MLLFLLLYSEVQLFKASHPTATISQAILTKLKPLTYLFEEEIPNSTRLFPALN